MCLRKTAGAFLHLESFLGIGFDRLELEVKQLKNAKYRKREAAPAPKTFALFCAHLEIPQQLSFHQETLANNG